jgi:outer membrane protein assembly factor BamB
MAWLPYMAIPVVMLSPASGTRLVIATARFDNSRDAANTSETILTPANVKAGKFGLVCKMEVDGDLFSQPLYVPHITVAGTPRDLILVATMHNSVYAFDANGCAPIWTTNFGQAWQFRNYPHIDNPKSPLFYEHEVGASNVVADSTNVYVVTASATGTWTLRKLVLESGAQCASVEISGQVVGSGDAGQHDSLNASNLCFNGARQLQRTALTLANAKIYLGFGGQSDRRPYHGWVFAYNTSDLRKAALFCTSPNSWGGGVWNGGGGLSVLPGGDILFSTGNGNYDGSTEFSQSVLRLNGSTLAVVDWFTPADWASMNTNDSDLGSGPMMLIPGSAKAVTGAKDFRIFMVDTSCMGHLGGTVGGCSGTQVFYTNARGKLSDHSGVYNGAFFNDAAFFPNTSGRIYRFIFRAGTAGTFDTIPATSPASYEFPGAQLSVSANATSNAIRWATTVNQSALYHPAPATLRALNPGTFSEYWNSRASGGDTLGILSKYAPPVVANGRVYVSTQSGNVVVYGLLR